MKKQRSEQRGGDSVSEPCESSGDLNAVPANASPDKSTLLAAFPPTLRGKIFVEARVDLEAGSFASGPSWWEGR